MIILIKAIHNSRRITLNQVFLGRCADAAALALTSSECASVFIFVDDFLKGAELGGEEKEEEKEAVGENAEARAEAAEVTGLKGTKRGLSKLGILLQ
jgi:hypothetical protein